jgi:hypothetical protein
MFNDLPTARRAEDMELEAYNAAFYELGLRWHWDGATWEELACAGDCRKARLRHYLQTRQAHLLRAYEADFLVEAIERAQARQRRLAESHPTAARVDWSPAPDRELGH